VVADTFDYCEGAAIADCEAFTGASRDVQFAGSGVLPTVICEGALSNARCF
jgi:hypothetical protein